jgi:hypothetical protein
VIVVVRQDQVHVLRGVLLRLARSFLEFARPKIVPHNLETNVKV